MRTLNETIEFTAIIEDCYEVGMMFMGTFDDYVKLMGEKPQRNSLCEYHSGSGCALFYLWNWVGPAYSGSRTRRLALALRAPGYLVGDGHEHVHRVTIKIKATGNNHGLHSSSVTVKTKPATEAQARKFWKVAEQLDRLPKDIQTAVQSAVAQEQRELLDIARYDAMP